MNTTNESTTAGDKGPSLTAADREPATQDPTMLAHSVKQSIESIHSLEDKLNSAYVAAPQHGRKLSRPAIGVLGSADHQSRNKHDDPAAGKRQQDTQDVQRTGAILVSDGR